jgi:tRNA threonylcarbamoyladenosine biosynthesis protein TsaE
MISTIPIPSLEAIPDAARIFLRAVDGFPVVAFSGELGAGKTTLIQALCQELGVEREVTSPTFALVNEYFNAAGESIFHFDLYRIEEEAELYDLGYEEYFYSGNFCFIEWPEKADRLIPERAVRARIGVLKDGQRELTFKLPSPMS